MRSNSLRFIYNSHCDIWCASSGKYFPRSFQLLLCVVSTCLFLLEVRVLALQGKTKRRRAHKMSKALPLLIKQFLNRPARLADECQVMQLINFLQMQLVPIFGDANMKHQAMIYWMAKETESYAGRCNMSRSNRTWGAGLVYRWKEHIKLYGSHLFGTVSQKQCRHRYNLFLRHSPQNYPTTVAISFSHRSTIASLEAAFIGIYLPSTNNLEKTFGLQARSNLAKLHRIKNQRKRSSTRFRLLTQLDDQQRQKNLLATSHLLKKQIASRVVYFKQCEVQMQAQAVIFKQMQMSFPQMYRQRVREGGIGPVSIFQHIDLLVKYASIYPQDVQWLTFIQSKGVDKIYEVLLASGWVQNYHARAKAQSSILNFCEEQRLPVKKHSFIVVSHRSHILPVRRWYGQILYAVRSVMPYMCESVRCAFESIFGLC